MAVADEGIRSTTTIKSVECAICLDELQTPKALPCLHTFCLACLQEHITATVKAKGTKLVCPECRSKCLPPNPKRPVGEWAKQFPTNFHLQNLIETSRQNRSVGNKGQETSRGSFAQRLKETRASVDNLLLDLRAEQQNVSATRSHVTSTWNKSKDHTVAIFAEIMSMVKKRKEDLVKKLDEEYVEHTQRLFDKEDHISSRMKQLRHCSDDITKLMTGEQEKASLGLVGIEQKLEETRQDMAAEDRAKQHPSLILLNESMVMPKMVNPVVCMKEPPSSDLVISPDEVARILSSISELGTFRADPPADSGAQQASPLSSLSLQVSVNRSNSNSPRSTPLLSGRPRTDSDEWCEVEYPPVPHEARSPTPHAKPEYVNCYSLVSQGDEKEPFVTGVCYVAGVLLLTDVNNRCLKAVMCSAHGRRDGVKCERLPLRSHPLCVSSVGRTQAVVGSKHCVYLIRVRDSGNLFIQVVETSKSYYGIAALSDGHRIAACSDQPPGVDILDLHTGKVTHTISKNPATRTPLFTSPFYITALPQGRLLVSDKDNSPPLTCVTIKGDVIYRYVRPASNDTNSLQLTWPLGVSGCSNGSTFVVDTAQHAVFQLSADGQTASKVLQDRARLRSPSALCFHEDTGNLFVVSNKGQMLLLYKLTNGSET